VTVEPSPDLPADPADVDHATLQQFNLEWANKNPGALIDDGQQFDDPTVDMPFAKADAGTDQTRLLHKTEFPWLFDPSKGVRWDFDPIELRNLGQANTWVGMLVQSITKEIAETPWTIVKQEDRAGVRKRLDTHPEQRTPITKADGPEEYPDAAAKRIDDLLRNPNPDAGWHDSVEMWLGDLLEVGSSTVVKYFPKSVYDGSGQDATLAVEPHQTEPRALQTSAPEVWTKDYDDFSGLRDGFWQFDKERAPGTGNADGGTAGTRGFRTPIHFSNAEIMWTDMTPRSNRRYGMPPTLLVKDFLQSLDLAVTQEQQYLSRGSIPSGAWVFEEWDRDEVKEWKTENAENIKGKPHKSLMFAGRGGDVRFEPMSMNFSELEFTERMQWYARVVASVFQVPTAVVGIEPEKVNYNTFQGERENFEENTLGPYMQKLERFINDQLIEPHWGRQYHFEFKPGVSESTRGMISDRIRKEWDQNLIKRSTALQELGRELPDDAPDGYKDELVEEDAGGPLEGVEMSVDTVDKTDGVEVEKGDPMKNGHDLDPETGEGICSETGETIEAETMGDLTGECPHCGDELSYIDEEDLNKATGVAVAFPNSGGPAFESRATLINFCDALAEVCNGGVFVGEHDYPDGMTGDLDGQPVRAVGISERKAYAVWSDYRDEAVALSDPHAIDTAGDGVEQSGEDEAGNASASVRKDDPLRGTDEWYLFDVQPHMVEQLERAIADDVRELFDSVLSDEQIQREIDRLAADAEGDDSGEGDTSSATSKSTTSLARRLREVLEQQRLAGDVADAIREHSADAVRETLEDTIEDADPDDADVDPDAVDVDAVTSKLRDRDVGFANAFADEVSETIRETVGDGWAEGKNSREIASDIAEQGDIMEGWGGAERIARQKLQVATGQARSEVAADMDKVEVWQDSGDDRVRDAHQRMDGKWVWPGDDWVVEYPDRGVQKESVPGDSEPSIGCRCVTLLRDREEVDRDDYAGDGSLN
jgi:phage portal protein BeeE